MANNDEIGLIRRELNEELDGSEQKMVRRLENAIRSRLVSANEIGQVTAETTIGGTFGWAIAKATAAGLLWARHKVPDEQGKPRFPLLGSRRADFWSGVANVAVGGGAFLLNAGVQSKPVPGAVRQTIRAGSSVTFFFGLNETIDAVADYIIAQSQANKKILQAAQAQLAQQQQTQPQPAAKK